MSNNSIVFLHLSDMHFRNEKDISDQHIIKIIDSLKSYKNISFSSVFIIVSGDITSSGDSYQFDTARKFLGSLIVKLNNEFKCKCTTMIVPGNHDVNHNFSPLSLSKLYDGKYSEIEVEEHGKLRNFYNFANFNKCFESSQIYHETKTLNVSGVSIKVNLINNAIFSTQGEYKGLLYLPKDEIEQMTDSLNADIVISVMHHAPDFYRDEIKNYLEDTIIKGSNILFHGHEHYNCSKQTSFEGSDITVVQSGGCLCDKGNWDSSSYIIGILDAEELSYSFSKFTWNNNSGQYEHDVEKKACFKQSNRALRIIDSFEGFKCCDEDKYYVFPTIMYHGKKSTEDFSIESISDFEEELKQHRFSVIVGSANIGKTSLLKQLFTSFATKTKYVLYVSPEKLLNTSSRKKQNIDKLIKSLFVDIYGSNDSDWQAFEQSDIKDCYFILDDFDRIDGINLNEFFKALSNRFGSIIISNNRTIDFDPLNINIEDVARFEIKAPVGHKRRELIRAVVADKANDKSQRNVENIVKQIDRIIKTQLNIIPPEPYYIIQMAENFMNNVGEAIYKGTNAFSKVFEANLTNRIDAALKNKARTTAITVDLMYLLLGKIAYYIHFNKAYPVKRGDIERIIKEYNDEYGKKLVTEDIINIVKASKIITDTEECSEEYRFRNKSILAYFVAKEIIERKDKEGLKDVINKACINICTDILLFSIYLADSKEILDSILDSVNITVKSDSYWSEFSIPEAVPQFITNSKQLKIDSIPIDKVQEGKQIEESEEITEESMITDFKIKDLYDWDDSIVDNFNNKLFRMTSLLQIIAKCLPCFEHLLKKDEKKKLIEFLYRLPNRIFMFWSSFVDIHYDEIIDELKTHPYFANKKGKVREKEIDSKAKSSVALFSMNLLLNLYYIPVLNATGKNTFEYLTDTEFFDFSNKPTYQLEHLMFVEQLPDSDDFVSTAISLKKEHEDSVFSYLLQCIVRHGLITRTGDPRDNIDRLESKFFPNDKKSLLINRAKNKCLNE